MLRIWLHPEVPSGSCYAQAKAPKADPKKDPITFDEYVKKLSSRGLAGSDVFTKKRTQKAWDVELIKLSGKLSASAIEASDEL